jgi:hypothetical protein
MRWRVLMNALDRSSARDRLERLSLAVDQLAPLIAIVMFVPMALILAGLGLYAGHALATSPSAITFEVLRFLLVFASLASIVGPLVMPSLDRTAAVRLLLLPIRREVLYAAQASSALTEPWVLLALPAVLALPFGLAAGGALSGAVIALIAGVLLILTLVSFVALSATILHLVVRDRRRGELVTLVFVIVIPVLSMLPGLLMSQNGRAERRAQRAEQAERTARGEETSGERAARYARRAFTLVPSELFARATRSSVRAGVGTAVIPLAALAATCAGLHALGFLLFGRLLDSPGSSSRSRARSPGAFSSVDLPGVSRGTTAVAQAHIRLVLRTPRGRAILLGPVVVFGAIAAITRQSGTFEVSNFALSNGLSLATFGASLAMLSIMPIAMNQFAIDRAGLTLAFLMPLDTRQLLAGKAIANAAIVGVPMLLSITLALVLFPGGNPALWISLPLGLIATYVVVAPVAALLSAVFPRAADLNSIGSKSNPHGVAGTLGLLSFGVASLPPIFLTMLAMVFERPGLTPLLVGIWCAIAMVLSRVLLNAVAVIFDKRRENLALAIKPKS